MSLSMEKHPCLQLVFSNRSTHSLVDTRPWQSSEGNLIYCSPHWKPHLLTQSLLMQPVGSGKMPRAITSCITALTVHAGNETSGMIIPRVNTHQRCDASSNQLHFSDSVVVLSFPSLLPPALIKGTHGYPKAAVFLPKLLSFSNRTAKS